MSANPGIVMRKFVLAALMAFFLVRPAMAEGEYVFILKARGNPYWQAVVDGINDAAKTNGIEASVYQLASDSAAEEQLNTCMAVLAKHPRFIAISSVTPTVGLACMAAATKQQAIVADLDENISPEDAEKAGFKLSFSLGSDNYVIGKNAADYLKQVEDGHDVQILVLEGSAGSVPGKKRVDGFTDEVKTKLPNSSIVASISGDWDRLKAMNIVLDTLQQNPGLNTIYGANDLMALGAVEAIRTAHPDHQIVVMGVDGTADGRKAVLAGTMTATVAQLPYLIGKRAVEKAIAVTSGKPTEVVEITPTPVLTKEMLAAGKDPLLQYVR